MILGEVQRCELTSKIHRDCCPPARDSIQRSSVVNSLVRAGKSRRRRPRETHAENLSPAIYYLEALSARPMTLEFRRSLIIRQSR